MFSSEQKREKIKSFLLEYKQRQGENILQIIATGLQNKSLGHTLSLSSLISNVFILSFLAAAKKHYEMFVKLQTMSQIRLG